MKTYIIKDNTSGVITLDEEARDNGVMVALLDDCDRPVAHYEFERMKIQGLPKLGYNANNCRVKFDITPSVKREICSNLVYSTNE